MPSSSPVYQPTTVTYERHKEWSNNYLTDTVLPNCRQKPFLQRLLLISSVLLVILGLGLAVFALVSEINTHHEDSGELPDSLKPVDEDKETHSSEENSETEIPPVSGGDGPHDHETNVVVGCVGICLVLLGFGLYIAFLHIKGACVGLIPSRSGHHSVPIQPESAAGADAADTGITYKGVQESTSLNLEPSVPAEEERHSLMDAKYRSEDTERMMEDDPRIVLKPLRAAEEA